jgi:hypothetical protein
MQHFRYTEAEIAELCKIPPWTESALDKHARRIHDQVPLTRKCIVDQCLFWCDVAQRFKRHMSSKKKAPSPDDSPDFVVGVLGCGSIGSKFVRQLVKRRVVQPNQIKISSRTPSRAKQRCGLEVVASNVEVAAHCTVLFLFVLPFHFRNFSREIRDTIQRARPLVISTLAGFTQVYLQRALNTPYLITTAVDMPTIGIAAARLGQEFPLAGFATGEEFGAFQEFFDLGRSGPEKVDGSLPQPEGPPPAPETETVEEQTEKPVEPSPEKAEDTSETPEESTEKVGATPIDQHADSARSQDSEAGSMHRSRSSHSTRTSRVEDGDEAAPIPGGDDPDENPFLLRTTEPTAMKYFHRAGFAAENLSNSGITNLNSLIGALRTWVALDPNHAKIQARPETYSRLWARSFVPLPCITKLETVRDKGPEAYEKPVRFLLKRAFIRSLVGDPAQPEGPPRAPRGLNPSNSRVLTEVPVVPE